ncbi:MAG: hypothetical protein RLZZ09_808 [Pseudomonadota bacterium]|jgi:hypothetical protein
MTQHLRIGGVRIDPYRGGFTASARNNRAGASICLTNDMAPEIYDLVAQAEVEGRHAVDALMRMSEARHA